MAPFQTAVTLDDNRDGEVIEVQILPQVRNSPRKNKLSWYISIIVSWGQHCPFMPLRENEIFSLILVSELLPLVPTYYIFYLCCPFRMRTGVRTQQLSQETPPNSQDLWKTWHYGQEEIRRQDSCSCAIDTLDLCSQEFSQSYLFSVPF